MALNEILSLQAYDCENCILSKRDPEGNVVVCDPVATKLRMRGRIAVDGATIKRAELPDEPVAGDIGACERERALKFASSLPSLPSAAYY